MLLVLVLIFFISYVLQHVWFPLHVHSIQGPTTDAFEWSSDSNEALDRTLSWFFNSYATIDAVEMQFPVGDTYKFDLELFDGGDDARQVLTVRTHLDCSPGDCS